MGERGLREIGERLGVEGLAGALEPALAAAPEPGAARRRAAELLDGLAEADSGRLAAAARQRPETLRRVVRALCAVAPFLALRLGRRPAEVLALLEDDLARPRSAPDLEARLGAALEEVEPGGEEAALRRFKYHELARLCARDASPALVPLERSGETLAELSRLADALLVRAFAVAQARVAARLGPPRWRLAGGGGPWELRVAVLGLGKLGGGELNFSSDVDLVYVFESPPADGPPEDGPGGLSPDAYAAHLLREFGALVARATEDGFLYRIDLELRPEGSQGPLVTGSNALVSYYDGWAAVWEKAAFTKARPVAGDLRFGWNLVRAVHPMIYRSAMDFAGVAAIHDMKERIEKAHGSAGDAFDVKVDAGGIRDVEFVTQALQLLHGGRMEAVRGRSTQAALASLAAHGLLEDDEAGRLLDAYRFLRRLENRLQMEDERQVHRLPAGGAGRLRAARALGFTGDDALEAFDGALEARRGAVREAFAALFSEDPEERILGLFERGAARLLRFPTTRTMLEELARSFARHIEAAPDPELALNNLDRFVQGVGTNPFYWELLLDRPELVPRLAKLFGASKYLSNLFAANPRLIEPVFADPEVLLLSREQLEAELAEIGARLAAGDREPADAALAALRLFHHRQLVNVGLLDLDGRIPRREAERALTEVAEVCLEGALDLARRQVGRGSTGTAPEGAFLVVGMGKLASRELTYGSDLDVIFLYDLPGAGGEDELALYEAQSGFARLAQKLIWALDTRTAEGHCFSVDARLRPSGQQGTLVTSLEGFRRHHARSAMLWERQALLRARPVAGDADAGRDFDALRREILARPVPDDLGTEIHRIRVRMEEELAREGGARRDLKLGRGGLVDVEFAVQYLQLRHGAEHPDLHDCLGTDEALERLVERGVLEAGRAGVLREGWDFLQRLSSRLRIVQNRSISDLDEDRADLDSVARALGYAPSSRTGDARRPLLEDYRRTTEAVRAVYLEVLGVEGSG